MNSNLPGVLEKYYRFLNFESGNALSQTYAFSDALKTEFTLHGKRTIVGDFDDFRRGAKRYVTQILYDAYLQNSLDFTLGKIGYEQVQKDVSHDMIHTPQNIATVSPGLI